MVGHCWIKLKSECLSNTIKFIYTSTTHKHQNTTEENRNKARECSIVHQLNGMTIGDKYKLSVNCRSNEMDFLVYEYRENERIIMGS